MKVHVLIALTASTVFHESGSPPFDLDTASSFLLNMFNISSSMTNNLSTKVKPRNWFKINRNLLLGPFALFLVSQNCLKVSNNTHSTKLVSLNLLWLSSAEASFIYEIR
jgi:hypothetical protein